MTHHRIWTAANVLSLIRIVLVGPIIFALTKNSSGGNRAAGVLVCAAAVTDFIDGAVARKFGEISEFGKIVDPLADKIAVAGVAGVLVLMGRIPAWYFLLAIGRDVLILSGGAYIRNVAGVTLQSTPAGKWAAGFTALCLFQAIVAPGAPAAITIFLLSLSSVMMIISFAVYAGRFFSLRKSNGLPR